MKEVTDAEGEHRDTQHLHEGRDAESPVIGVVGAREPDECQPRPNDGEHAEQEGEDPSPHMTHGKGMSELGACERERHNKRQVVQQFQGCGGSMRFVGIAPRHRDEAMAQAAGDAKIHGSPFNT